MVGTGQFDLRHVTADAAGVRDSAGLGHGLATAVAGEAFGVVIDRLAADFAVRIVAGQATDARIVGIVALASG